MLEINGIKIGDGNPAYIVFEAGPTHNGLTSAMQLVQAAHNAGANAVKFQMFDPDKAVHDKQMLFSYSIAKDYSGKTEIKEEALYDILKRRTLTDDEWLKLRVFCEKSGIAFFCTAAFEEDIDFLTDLRCNSIKIASGDVNHWPLIRHAARTGMCIQLDTGNATLGEIEDAVDIVLSEGNKNIIIHQCPSGYPARLPSINLNIIPTLKKMFGLPVAYSDHTPGWNMDIAAVALGANLVEKTITMSRITPSIEHMFSVEPHEAIRFVEEIREVEIAMGSTRRVMAEAELEKRKQLRRSAYLLEDAQPGQSLNDLKIEFRRPAMDGVSPDLFDILKDTHYLACPLKAGTKLYMVHIR